MSNPPLAFPSRPRLLSSARAQRIFIMHAGSQAAKLKAVQIAVLQANGIAVEHFLDKTGKSPKLPPTSTTQ